MRLDLYPPLEPFAVQQVRVDRLHALHVEQSGNPRGFPAIFLHGGPGSQTQALHRRFFDPAFYRIVLFDQRGCGRSTPLGCTEANTTHHLVQDIEALRTHLALGRVVLFAGSWGAALALAYAAVHPERVAALVLRGVFLGSRAEVDEYLRDLRLREGGDVLARYHALVNQRDEAAALAAARRWVAYEDAVMRRDTGEAAAAVPREAAEVLARARVQLHYLAHDCFLEPEELFTGVQRIRDTRTLIVQGERDRVCPPRVARALAARLPRAELRLVVRGGHSAAQPDMAQALRRATDDLRGWLQSMPPP